MDYIETNLLLCRLAADNVPNCFNRIDDILFRQAFSSVSK